MIFYHVLSEAALYQGKPLDLSNTLINARYLEKLVCQDLMLQSILSFPMPSFQLHLGCGSGVRMHIYMYATRSA